MRRVIAENAKQMGTLAAAEAAQVLRRVVNQQGAARLVVATGASQFHLFESLIAEQLEWSKVTGFHLDEYVGIAPDHPASFVRYLRERFVQHVPLQSFHYLDTSIPVAEALETASKAVSAHPIDLLLCGIGENGHLAFNDPPADFDTEQPYLEVTLDDACRLQQVGEGWFADLASVPKTAISMSIRQIMKARHIICSVPDARKAVAVQRSLEEPVSPMVPASILQQHPNVSLYLDKASAKHLGG